MAAPFGGRKDTPKPDLGSVVFSCGRRAATVIQSRDSARGDTMTIRTVLVLSLFLLASAGAQAEPAQTLASQAAVEPGWLGVSLGSPESGPDGGTDPAGVKVIGVVRGSPAQKAGLRVRDVIISVEGKPVRTAKDVIGVVTSLPPGSSLTLGVSRRGEE